MTVMMYAIWPPDKERAESLLLGLYVGVAKQELACDASYWNL
jgi:hypothetical protein